MQIKLCTLHNIIDESIKIKDMCNIHYLFLSKKHM
jgi:hypothetical protein